MAAQYASMEEAEADAKEYIETTVKKAFDHLQPIEDTNEPYKAGDLVLCVQEGVESHPCNFAIATMEPLNVIEPTNTETTTNKQCFCYVLCCFFCVLLCKAWCLVFLFL